MMIQDIGNHIFHNEFDNKEVTEDDIVFVFYGKTSDFHTKTTLDKAMAIL